MNTTTGAEVQTREPSAVIVARRPEWSPIYHYGSGTRVRRITWKVDVEMISTGERESCCDSTHGHTTKQNAAKCLDKKLRKVIARQSIAAVTVL